MGKPDGSKKEKKSAADKEYEKPVVAKTAYDLQRLKLMKLMKNPEKPILLPERPKSKNSPSVPEFVRNVMGSSAGAGSGEFHVYRHLRRKEYSRQKFIQEKGRKETLDEEYHKKIEQNKEQAEQITAKKRAKRLKKKQKQKQAKKFKTYKNTEGNDEKLEDSDSNSDTSEDENEKKNKRDGKNDSAGEENESEETSTVTMQDDDGSDNEKAKSDLAKSVASSASADNDHVEKTPEEPVEFEKSKENVDSDFIKQIESKEIVSPSKQDTSNLANTGKDTEQDSQKAGNKFEDHDNQMLSERKDHARTEDENIRAHEKSLQH